MPRLRRSFRRRLAAVVLLALLPLTGCSDDPPPGDEPDVAAAVEQAIGRTLQQRSRALRDRDRQRFLGSVLRRDRGFLATQRTYFANLAQLPIETVRFQLDAATLVPQGKHYWGEVVVRLRLLGYDAAPVVTRDRFRFTRSRDGRRYLVSSTTDADWERDRQVQQQPWDLGPVQVRESGGVLGVFDAGTIARADAVLSAVDLGRYDVTDQVPSAGLVDVVVYALSDLRFLESLPGLPVDDPTRLDAATVPVLSNAERGRRTVASYRILVHPRVLAQEIHLLDRLMRHELTHVMVGDRADGAPLWLSEGIAEYVSVQPVSPALRRLPASTLDLVHGGIDGLPDDEVFGTTDAEAWYGVSWWICEYVARTYGEATLWRLLDELAGDADQATEIPAVLGITPEQLVQRSMHLLLGRYDAPPPPPTPSPTPLPTPTPTPTAPAPTPGASTVPRPSGSADQ